MGSSVWSAGSLVRELCVGRGGSRRGPVQCPNTHAPTAWYRRGSRVSLVSASLSTFILLAAFVLSFWFPVISFAIGAIVAINLAINFAVRLQATRKFMPAGMLMLISLGVFVFLVILAARAPIKGLPDVKQTRDMEQPPHALTLPSVGLAQSNGGGKELVPVNPAASLHPQPETVRRRLRWRRRN